MLKKNDFENEEISASELNKFTYCNYQWYYEKVYGSNYINKARKELLEELGYDDTSKSNFAKGQKFHQNYDDGFVMNRGVTLVLSVILVVVIICIVYYIGWAKLDI